MVSDTASNTNFTLLGSMAHVTWIYTSLVGLVFILLWKGKMERASGRKKNSGATRNDIRGDGSASVLGNKETANELHGFIIISTSIIFREGLPEVHGLHFLLEQVLLVQEQHECLVPEKVTIDHLYNSKKREREIR
jgi:hypothetical protein